MREQSNWKRNSLAAKVPQKKTLSHLTDLGASRRRHRIFRDISSFSAPIFLAIGLQSIAYLAFYTRTVPNWAAGLAAIGVLSLVPIFSAVALSAFRRHKAPIMVSVGVVIVFFSFAITFLSSMRVPMSFAGFGAALPLTVIVMAIGNIRFHNRLSARVGLITFDNQEAPLSFLGNKTVSLINYPDDSIDKIDTILIDPKVHHNIKWSTLLARCYVAGVDIMPWTHFLEIRKGKVHVPDFEVAELIYTPSQILYSRCKRLLDIAFVVVTLPLTLPISAFVAIYIFLRDGGPVLFVQHRRGFGGRVFRMFKFRTMFIGTAGGSTSRDDKRIIPGGNFLRKARLDELPQLYNILLGDMSLIGPRPAPEYVFRRAVKFEKKYAVRNLIVPGITGWAQVKSGYAGTTEEEIEKLSYDLYYLKNQSFDLDLQILFKTIKTVLVGWGAR